MKRQNCSLGDRGVKLLKLMGKNTREEEATQRNLYGGPICLNTDLHMSKVRFYKARQKSSTREKTTTKEI